MNTIVPVLLEGNPSSAAAYEALLMRLADLGPVVVAEKKTSLHITNGRAAFLGVHPRKQGLRLNIVLPHAIESSRIVKAERVSASRFHNELDVTTSAEVDDELADWIRQAYAR